MTLPQELVQSKPTSLALHEIIDADDVIILQFESPGGPGGPVGPKTRLITWFTTRAAAVVSKTLWP